MNLLNNYSWLLKNSPALYKKVKRIIENIVTDRTFIFNKGEKLKYAPKRYSARIDRKNRLIYDRFDDLIVLISCRGHYDDK
ncbi:MAG: type II toxin-antitoxin system YoeB family toxin [Opitutales bacterium]